MSTVVVTSTENQGLVLERPPEKRRPLPRKAAGAQITHSQNEEVVKRNNDVSLLQADNRNGNTVNRLSINNWRASLVPAAAVIPALKVYIAIAAVKKLVVGSAPSDSVRPTGVNWDPRLILLVFPWCSLLGVLGG